MDPNEALARARSAATAIRETGDPARVVELLEGFESLDAWLSSGGFVPAEWSGATGASV